MPKKKAKAKKTRKQNDLGISVQVAAGALTYQPSCLPPWAPRPHKIKVTGFKKQPR